MTIEIRQVARLRLREEAAGTYGVDMTTGGTVFTSFADVPFINGTLSVSPQREMLPTNYAQQFIDGYSEEVPGRKTWTLSYQMHLAPTGVLSDSALSSVEGSLGTNLKIIMGGQSLSAGTAIASGASATGATVTGGQGSRVPVGTGIGLTVQTTPTTYEMVEVLTQATDAITWKVAVATTPTSAIYRASTYYMKEDPDTSAQFVLEFVETDDRWVLMGGQGGFTVEVGNGGIPTVTFTWSGSDWTQYTGSAIATASFTNLNPVAMVSSVAQVATVGSTTRNVLPVQALTITPNIAYTDIRYPGSQTIYRKRRNRTAPIISGAFTIPYEANTWLSARDSSTDRALFVQIGSVPGGMLLIAVPTIQIVDAQPTDVGGSAGQIVSFKGRHDAALSAGATEITRSPFRLHLC